ncbi:cAMP-dependent protein kinase catalytic subunit alpha-like [Macrosteles quadrilineatus]|uniref:cAMP-dependent protein kinase catalytic subunit alpha-like n=1 Tax=Macrosteles quadrilineatus TaxID=74068 RepID=UPI0023E1AF40|nr:cAMP-dependent protein kinase catalytic subunit alpha-like [Macrosteles quadrilineatus]
MQRVKELLGGSVELDRIPDYGPLDLPEYSKFLEETKTQFYTRWNDLLSKKEQPINLQYNGYSLDDFQRIKLIGAGNFGNVYLVSNIKTGAFHAMKSVLKTTVVRLKQVNNARTEKLVLQCTTCPFTIRLDYFFKDNSYLYFVLPFVRGGDLFRHLQRSNQLSELSAMFYLAQVILAIEYLHYMDIIYRDLKPENVLIDHTGYIKLTDFGFCKRLTRGRTYTICGTPDYITPETLRSEGYGKGADWWAVGVLAYELTVGVPPFKDKSDSKRYFKIVSGKYSLPPPLSEELKDLISNVLQIDKTKRFGNMSKGVNDFKTHKWFKPLNWMAVACRKASPPFTPDVDAENDTRHFKDLTHRSLRVADHVECGQEFADF